MIQAQVAESDEYHQVNSAPSTPTWTKSTTTKSNLHMARLVVVARSQAVSSDPPTVDRSGVEVLLFDLDLLDTSLEEFSTSGKHHTLFARKTRAFRECP